MIEFWASVLGAIAIYGILRATYEPRKFQPPPPMNAEQLARARRKVGGHRVAAQIAARKTAEEKEQARQAALN